MSTTGRPPEGRKPLFNYPLAYAAEITHLGDPIVDWKPSCLLDKRPGEKHMQGIQAYIGSEQQFDVRTREKVTREMLDVLPCRVASFCRTACGPRDETKNTDCVVMKALVCAYINASKLKGSAEMSTWLTAVALLIVGPDCAEAPAPAVSTKTPTRN